MPSPRSRRRGAAAAAAAVLVVSPVLVLSACSGSASEALNSLASRASSAIASATASRPTADKATSAAATTSQATSTPTKTDTPTATDSPSPTDTATETKTETATATETRTETATVTPTPSPSRSESKSPEPVPASTSTPWWPYALGLLAGIVVGLVIWRVVRSRQRHAWEEQVRTATASLDPFAATFLPHLIAAPTDPSMPGTWTVVRPQVIEATRMLDTLVPNAPDAAAGNSVAGLSEAAKSAGAAVDTALAPGTVVTSAAVQDLVVRRDALVEASRSARHAAGPPPGGSHS
jgi:hypothetical protein